MKRNLSMAVLAVIVIGVLGVAAVAYSFLRTPEEASLSAEEALATVQAEQPPTEQPEAPTAEATPTQAVEPTAEPTTPPEATAEPTAASETSTARTFAFVDGETEAQFIIDEVLRGSPKTVVGSTSDVAGTFTVDFANPAEISFSPILINARTFATDDERRDRAIKNRILLTDQYEFITFEPKSVVGAPERVEVGQTYTFQVVGDLTILDTTREVVFDVEATVVSENRVEGTARAVVQYADWGVSIPEVPAVTGVADEVTLILNFAAEAQ